MARIELGAVLDALPVPCLAINRNDDIVAANTACQKLFGQAIVGRNFLSLLRQPALVDAVEQTLLDGQSRQVPWQARLKARDMSWQVDVSECEGQVLLCFRDLAHREQAAQMRRDFVANVSHELRTPLTSLMGFIETLDGPARDDPAARSRFLQIMMTEATRMNRLIDDLLSLSRLEAQARERPRDTVELADLLPAVLHSLSGQAKKAGVDMDLQMPQETGPLVGDADQLTQVFTNLVENAIKYGGSGGQVTITAAPVAHDARLRGPAVMVEVSDNGPGIAAHHIPRLTERFYRADAHRSRSLGGTGLGLAIVKHILGRHGGYLSIKSTPGQGAGFTVHLPAPSP